MSIKKSIFQYAEEKLGVESQDLNFRFPIEILDNLLKKFYGNFEITSFLIQANNSIDSLKLKKISNSYLLQAPIDKGNLEQFYVGLSDRFSFLLLFEDCGVQPISTTRSKVFLTFDDNHIKQILDHFCKTKCEGLSEAEKELLNKLKKVKVKELDVSYLAKFQEALLVNALRGNNELKEKKIVEAISFSDESIIITDLAGNIKEKNKNFESTFCTSQVIISKISDLLPPKLIKSSFSEVSLDKPWQVEYEMKTAEKRDVYSVSCYLLKDDLNRPEGFVYTLKDITSLRKLNHVNKQLIERLRTKNVELSDVNKRLLNADRIKVELLSVVSHELKTPISTIIGFSELIESRDDDKDTVKLFAKEIGTSAKKLNKLLSDYLDVASNQFGVQSTRLNTTSINLSELIKSLFDEQSSKYSNVKFNFEINTIGFDPMIISETPNLQKLFSNVLDNAMKYSPNGGKISVKLFSDGNNVTVSVADEGVGISNENAKRVFEPFYRSDNSLTREFEGMGLGLSVSRKIVEIYNGSIWCEPGVDKGTVFYVTLPVNPHKPTNTYKESPPKTIEKLNKMIN